MLSKMCDKYSQRPPSQEFVTLFFWEKKYSFVETPLPPCWQMSLNTQVFFLNLPFYIYTNKQCGTVTLRQMNTWVNQNLYTLIHIHIDTQVYKQNIYT